MQIRVDVPVHVIIDADTAASHLDHLDEALTAAAGRALNTAKDVIEKRHGEPGAQRLRDPVVSWSGPGLPALNAQDRHEVEKLVHTVLTTAGAGAFPRAARVGKSDGAAPDETARPVTKEWVQGLEELSAQDLFALARFDERFAGAWPPQFGVVVLIGDGQLGVLAWRHPSGDQIFNKRLVLEKVEKVVDNGRMSVTSKRFSPPASATYHLRYHGLARTAAELEKVFYEMVGPETDPALNADLATAAREWVDQKLATRVVGFVVLEVDGELFYISLPVATPHDLNVELVPIVADVPAKETDGPGGLGNSRVTPGGSLGETTGGERVWPVAGIATETLVCEPFLGEPPVSALADDHGLLARMRALAAALEVPECGYLGMFALNCAKVISGRAWSIGVSSTGSATTTAVTVHNDGGGNNAFVDIQPGASPEFDYVRALGRIAAQVHAFGDDVATAYLDPRNARPGGAWEPGRWSLHFGEEFRPQVVTGYEYLYAETCRMLLLQQLRSSKEGIDGRLGGFEHTLTSFTDTLDSLGAAVVELSVLRTAIRHSREVFVTGRVREVLAVPLQLTNSDGVSTTLPAPIDSVSPRIIAAIGDVPVERRGGRTVVTYRDRVWSVDDLDAEIGRRRGVINVVDPMFLQVADLDRLFETAQRNPVYARGYLKNLLSDMSTANEGMTSKARQPFTGAFFALEASQYVRREGVRGWYGLKYELQGIHLLADGQLRPSTGGDPLYDQGINAAIGHKADFDEFVSAFSTVGVIALGLLCAPLGALVAGAVTAASGVVLAVHDVREARRLSDLHGSLEHPDLFVPWQDVELAQLMATLSIAFAVFDVAGVAGEAAHAIVGTARQALRVAERGGAGMAAAYVGREAKRDIRRVVRNMTDKVIENAARQALTQGAIAEVMNLLLPEVIEPVLVPWLRDQAREHGTLTEVDEALGTLAGKGDAS